MKSILIGLLQTIIISGILYSYYHFFLRNKKFHQYNRYYLLASVLLSICIPFLNIPVYFTKEYIAPSTLLQALTTISAGSHEMDNPGKFVPVTRSWFTWINAAYVFYLLIALIILVRLVTAVLKIHHIARNNPVEKMDDIRFVNTEEEGTPFSFLRWLFWNRKLPLDSDNGRQVFRHELYHIRERHSWDIIFLETIRMIFWINPFFHLICKEIKVIHEFLADKFAANKNEEWNYAELLLMQLLGSPNHRLVNPFFHNQIKRRIAMITSSQKTSYQYLRKLLVLPVAAFVTMLFAFKYKTGETKTNYNFEKIITVVVDAGHGTGTGTTALDGTTESDITLAIAKKVKSLNSNDRIKILLTRESAQDVDLKKRGEFTNSQKADLFISVHTNYANTPEKSGFEVVVPRKNKTYYAENQIFGAIVLNYFMNIYKTDNEIKQREEGIYELDQSACPSVLIECGYLSNKKDLEYIKSPGNQKKIANSILQSIEQFATQQELPDFEEKKKQEADTIDPQLKLYKDASGKTSGTYYDQKITDLLVDSNRIVGFAFENGTASMVPENIIERAEAEYKTRWKEYISSFRTSLTSNNFDNQDTLNNKVFEKVEVEATFPGGDQEWANYLNKNLNTNIASGTKAPEGTYTVWIQFIVNKDGSIQNIKPITSHGYGMEGEAIRVLKKGPRWQPALQNGKKVNAYRKQRFDFAASSTTAAITLPEVTLVVYIEPFDKSVEYGKLPAAPHTIPGSTEWRTFIERNTDFYAPLKDKWKTGTYKLNVSFAIDKNGDITEVRTDEKKNSLTANQCIKLISNFSKVNVEEKEFDNPKIYYIQPLTYIIEG